MSVQAPWTPRTEDEKDQVRRQMERLLATAHFKKSHRYPALFRAASFLDHENTREKVGFLDLLAAVLRTGGVNGIPRAAQILAVEVR